MYCVNMSGKKTIKQTRVVAGFVHCVKSELKQYKNFKMFGLTGGQDSQK